MFRHPQNKCLRVAGDGGWWFWCPGCERHHAIYPDSMGGNGPRWRVESISPLTISPSLLVRFTRGHGDEEQQFRCHSFIKNGQIQFLSDCTHTLKGKTVDMVED